MYKHLRTVLPLIVAMAGGCASMSETQCLNADWVNQGLSDGRAGHSAARIEEHREACAKAGVTPDAARWAEGHAQGVKSYCTANSGWNAGVSNRTYQGACVGLDEGTFLRYHRAGQLVWRARQDLAQVQSKIGRLEDDLKRATQEDKRRSLRDDLHRADRERLRLTTLLVTLEAAGPPR